MNTETQRHREVIYKGFEKNREKLCNSVTLCLYIIKDEECYYRTGYHEAGCCCRQWDCMPLPYGYCVDWLQITFGCNLPVSWYPHIWWWSSTTAMPWYEYTAEWCRAPSSWWCACPHSCCSHPRECCCRYSWWCRLSWHFCPIRTNIRWGTSSIRLCR